MLSKQSCDQLSSFSRRLVTLSEGQGYVEPFSMDAEGRSSSGDAWHLLGSASRPLYSPASFTHLLWDSLRLFHHTPQRSRQPLSRGPFPVMGPSSCPHMCPACLMGTDVTLREPTHRVDLPSWHTQIQGVLVTLCL